MTHFKFIAVIVCDVHSVAEFGSIESIKNTLMEADTGLLLAADLAEPSVTTVSKESMLFEAKQILDQSNLECIPVVSADKKIVGFIERRTFDKIYRTSQNEKNLSKNESFMSFPGFYKLLFYIL